jgi:hypothetical protein
VEIRCDLDAVHRVRSAWNCDGAVGERDEVLDGGIGDSECSHFYAVANRNHWIGRVFRWKAASFAMLQLSWTVFDIDG